MSVSARSSGGFLGGWNAAALGDCVILTDGTGQGECTLYDVYGIRRAPFFGEGPGGATVIWAVTTPTAPYTLDKNAATGAISAGNSFNSAVTPDAFQLQNNEVAQMRFKLKFIDNSGSNSGAHVGNFDLSAFNPGSVRAWGTRNVAAIVNARGQVGDPADAIALPNQDNNMAAPTSTLNYSGYERGQAEASELFWYYSNVPSFNVKWNGAGSTPAGIALALETSGYVYYVKEHRLPTGVVFQARNIGGYLVNVPSDIDYKDIVPLQIAAPN